MRLANVRQRWQTYLFVRRIRLLQKAVLRDHNLAIRYNGQEKWRLVAPQIIGTKGGHWRLFGVQLEGFSEGGLEGSLNWRCFFLDKISEVRLVSDGRHVDLSDFLVANPPPHIERISAMRV